MRFVRYALVAAAALLVYLGITGIPPFDNWSMNSLFLAVLGCNLLGEGIRDLLAKPDEDIGNQ